MGSLERELGPQREEFPRASRRAPGPPRPGDFLPETRAVREGDWRVPPPRPPVPARRDHRPSQREDRTSRSRSSYTRSRWSRSRSSCGSAQAARWAAGRVPATAACRARRTHSRTRKSSGSSGSGPRRTRRSAGSASRMVAIVHLVLLCRLWSLRFAMPSAASTPHAASRRPRAVPDNGAGPPKQVEGTAGLGHCVFLNGMVALTTLTAFREVRLASQATSRATVGSTIVLANARSDLPLLPGASLRGIRNVKEMAKRTDSPLGGMRRRRCASPRFLMQSEVVTSGESVVPSPRQALTAHLYRQEALEGRSRRGLRRAYHGDRLQWAEHLAAR